MDKRLVKLIIVSALLIVAAYWVASRANTFATALFAFIPICYFIAKGLKSLGQISNSIEVRTNFLIGIVSFVALLSMCHAVYVVSDQGLRSLTMQRKQSLEQLRPTLLKYKEEHGSYPKELQDLIPKYLQAIPPELLNDGKEDVYKKIIYEYDEKTGEVTFIFDQMRGPDSRVTYHVSENRYEYAK